MSILITQRPNNPKTSIGIVNGTFTGSITPWVNFGSGTAWAYDSNDVKITITSGDSKSLRQPYNAQSGVTYAYSFTVIVSSEAAFSIAISFMRSDGTTQSIRSVTTVNGTNTYSGTVVASADAIWIRFIITENIP